MELQRCILIFALAFATAPLANAHPELYRGCTVDHSNSVLSDEITPGPDSSIDTLDKCDNSCLGHSSCTYFTWNHCQGSCKWFTGVYANAPTNVERFSVAGVAGCTAHMQQEAKEPCANPGLAANYGTCESSNLAMECNIGSVRPLTSCTYCGEEVTGVCPAYTLCEGDEHETPNQDSVINLKVHCHGVCSDVEVNLDMLRGYKDRMGLSDDYEPGHSCHTRHHGYGSSGRCDKFLHYAVADDVISGTYTFKDDSFYAEITDYLYNDNDYAGDVDEVKYTISIGSGNAFAITCHSERGPDDLSLDYIRSNPISAKLKKQKDRSGKASNNRRGALKRNKQMRNGQKDI